MPLRHGLPQNLLDGKQSYSDTYQTAIDAARRALAPPNLRIQLRNQRINAVGIDIPLSPVEISFYAWLAQRCINDQAAPACPKDGVPEPAYAQALLIIHQQVIGQMGGLDRTAAALSSGMDKSYFEQRKTHINKQLKQALGSAARRYLITHFGPPSHRTHGLDLLPGAITLQPRPPSVGPRPTALFVLAPGKLYLPMLPILKLNFENRKALPRELANH